MTAALLVALVLLSLWLAVKLGSVTRENVALRATVESLKRQLRRLR